MNEQRPTDERYAIAIECSNPNACVDGRGEVGLARIGDDGSLVCVGVGALPESMRGSDGIMSGIEEICGAHGVGKDQIGRVVVSIGPGGYTGLRVSVTLAKVLSMSLGCSVVGVPSAAVAGVSRDTDSEAVIALASKNGKAHCTRVGDGEIQVIGVIGAEEVAGFGGGVLVADKHLPTEMREAAEGAGLVIEGLRLGAEACFKASAGFLEQDPGTLAVMYAREPDAVTQWRALHGS
jgi:tRNA A37 threonylcarbamoyladenosine modification protein TsaB